MTVKFTSHMLYVVLQGVHVEIYLQMLGTFKVEKIIETCARFRHTWK